MTSIIDKQPCNVLYDIDKAISSKINYSIGKYIPKKDSHYSVVMQNDGIYEVRENRLGVFVIRTIKAKFYGLENTLKEGFTSKIPKIPKEKFAELLSFYKYVYKLYNSEVYVSLYYNLKKKEFHFYVPNQIVSKAKVKYEDHTPEIFEIEKDSVHVLEAHSHNTMGGMFSPIDDKDQQECDVIHLVIGDILDINPSYSLRFAHGDNKVNINAEDIFDLGISSDINIDELFPEWENRIKLIDTSQSKSINDEIDYALSFTENHEGFCDDWLDDIENNDSNFSIIKEDTDVSLYDVAIYEGWAVG